MDPPALDNRTDFVVHPQPLLHKDGEHLVTVVKGTFEHWAGARELELAPRERWRRVRPGDVHWGDPAKTSVLYPGDLCVRKPGTDVVVVAKAYAPSGRPVGQFDVGVRVGAVSRLLRIFGPRLWRGAGTGLSDPQPIAELELRWEHAWGGTDSSADAFAEEPRNPLGRGVALDPATLAHTPAPQIEDPQNLVTSARTRPKPAGLGAIGRSWEPRRGWAGTYDDRWLEDRAPMPPADQDDRFQQCAAPDLVASPPLRGGEEVALSGLSPGGGGVAFNLPRVPLAIEYRTQGRDPVVFRPALDTVLVDLLGGAEPGRATVELVWRAAVKTTRHLRDVRVIVSEARP